MKKEKGHDIEVLNFRDKKKWDQYHELSKDFEEGKITWDYFWEKSRKLFVTKQAKTKTRDEQNN